MSSSKQSSNGRRSDHIHTCPPGLPVKTLTETLIECNCLKLGEFKLKSGATSEYYIDLRESTLSPKLFHYLVEAVKVLIEKEKLDRDGDSNKRVAIVGVPYGVVPIAGAVAYDLKLPYYPVRKEIKDYGNRQTASLSSDFEYILIEDVMSSGSSIIETIKKLDAKKVTDVVVIVDRESGGEDNIRRQYPDIRLHSVLKASHILESTR